MKEHREQIPPPETGFKFFLFPNPCKVFFSVSPLLGGKSASMLFFFVARAAVSLRAEEAPFYFLVFRETFFALVFPSFFQLH